MNSSEIIINIRENYKDCDDRLEKLYRKEFDSYSPTKLKEVWETIQENHSYAKAPELGNIFKYMFMVGIARTKDLGMFYHRCTELKPELDQYGKEMFDVDGDPLFVECGTKYSTKSKFCPKCNNNSRLSAEGQEKYNCVPPVFNTIEVIKCNSLPNDLRVLNELCATCSKYQKSTLVKGSKCSAWNTHDEYKKSGKDCVNCCCYTCCNEKPMNGNQHATLKKTMMTKRV